ncbi:glycerate kinase [Brevibacterium casei]|uniref:glycerate kinase n=1 Tax=Brevibacterium casei TaxID=33889 RepID=UPI001CBA6678|nr:glycerate kinase [Brevibacterium casei]
MVVVAPGNKFVAAKLAPPGWTATLGFGQPVHAVLGQGARQVILALGGSATTDGGAGMPSALGVRFHDSGGKAFTPLAPH